MIRSKVGGFSLIELIVTIVLMAIIMIPIALMLMEYVRVAAFSDSMAAVMNLVNREMGIVRLLQGSLTPGKTTFQNYAGSGFDLDRDVGTVLPEAAMILPVETTLYPHGAAAATERVLSVPTYVTEYSGIFGAGSSGETAAGPQNQAFTASGGTVTRDYIRYIALANSRAANLTIGAIEMYCAARGGANAAIIRSLRWITMGGQTRLTGVPILLSEDPNLPTLVTLYRYIYMKGNTTYSGSNGASFYFIANNQITSYTCGVRYVFIDGTRSDWYTYTYGA